MDIAKSVVEDTTIKVRKDWRFGELLLHTTQELYNSFDTTNVRFNNPEIDSLLKRYGIMGIKSKSREPSISRYFIHLLFPKYYNMIILSKMLGKVEGVIAAEQNIIGGSIICYSIDIKLMKENEIYKFIFRNCYNHIWVVQVVDDRIIDITEWDLI